MWYLRSFPENRRKLSLFPLCMMLPLVQLRRINTVNSTPKSLFDEALTCAFDFPKSRTVHCHYWMSSLFRLFSFWFFTFSLNSSPVLQNALKTFQHDVSCFSPLSSVLYAVHWNIDLQLCSGKVLARAHIKVDTTLLRSSPAKCFFSQLRALCLYQYPLTCFCIMGCY